MGPISLMLCVASALRPMEGPTVCRVCHTAMCMFFAVHKMVGAVFWSKLDLGLVNIN